MSGLKVCEHSIHDSLPPKHNSSHVRGPGVEPVDRVRGICVKSLRNNADEFRTWGVSPVSRFPGVAI